MQNKDWLLELESIISYYAQSDEKEVYNGAIIFKNLLEAYKKDEELIKEMAKELRMRQYNCYGKSTKTIIQHFRKKCE